MKKVLFYFLCSIRDQRHTISLSFPVQYFLYKTVFIMDAITRNTKFTVTIKISIQICNQYAHLDGKIEITPLLHFNMEF